MTHKPFNKNITYQDKYAPAMKITDQTEADVYFERCVQHTIINFDLTRAEAGAIERANLGYCVGYYDEETRARVERLFRCAHPFFGAIAENGTPTVEQAIKLGQELAIHTEKIKNDAIICTEKELPNSIDYVKKS